MFTTERETTGAPCPRRAFTDEPGAFCWDNIVAQLLAFRTMFILRIQRTSAPEQSRGPLGGRGSGLANLPSLR